MIDSNKLWCREDMPKGSSCVYSDILGFDIYLDSNDKILHIEDTKRGSSITRAARLNEDINRLNLVKQLIEESDLKWERK